jgi:hypothetical protein
MQTQSIALDKMCFFLWKRNRRGDVIIENDRTGELSISLTAGSVGPGIKKAKCRGNLTYVFMLEKSEA